MSDRFSYRRAAAVSTAELLAFEESFDEVEVKVSKPKRKSTRRHAATKSSEDTCEAIHVSRDVQLEVIEELAGYFRKKSNLMVSLGALSPSDRTWKEACMGDAAIRALPYYDPAKNVKRSTFLIQAVENWLIDDSRFENRKKRKAIKVPISTLDIVEATERGLVSEDGLEDRSRGGWKAFFFELDRREFYASLTEYEKWLLECRLDGLSFDELAEIAGYSTNSFKRKIWRPIQDKAVKFGGFEGKLIEV